MSDRPLGAPVDFAGARPPDGRPLSGRYVALRPLDPPRDAPALHAASREAWRWDYLFDGPYESPAALEAALRGYASATDRVFYAVLPEGATAPAGVLSYLRIEPAHGTIEIGNILFGAGLARTRAATETIFLLAAEAFDGLGYRRLEWKCNALNAASRRAAVRFGFRFEGVFAQHMVIKGRNRDTAWYAITDREWPAVRAGLQAWLAPGNFDADGVQRRRLEDFMPPRG